MNHIAHEVYDLYVHVCLSTAMAERVVSTKTEKICEIDLCKLYCGKIRTPPAIKKSTQGNFMQFSKTQL